MKEVKKSSAKAKKSYAKPKLATHGDVRKLTQHGGPRSVGSGIFDHGWGDGHDHGLHKGNH